MERWLPVPGYEDLYDVSDSGRLRSVRRPGTRGGLKEAPVDEQGYPQVSLCRQGSQATFRLHQLVALAFIGSCPPGQEVRHLDGNPANSAASNLAYGTSGENKMDTVSHGTHHEARKTHCPNDHEYTPENTALSRRGNGKTFRQCRKCANARSNAWHARKRATSQGNSPR